MKKILAISLIAIFLLSIVAVSTVYSKDGSDDDQDDDSKDNFEKMREISKENQEKAFEKIKDHQEKFRENQEKAKELKKQVNSQKGTKQIQVSKEFMLTNIDLMIEYLQKLKSKVESSEDISDVEASQIIDQIDQRIDKLNEQRDLISTTDNINGLRLKLKDIKDFNEDLTSFSIESADKITHRRVGEIIKRSESLERKLDRILANTNSTNQSQVNSLVNDFKAKIADAKDKYQKALDLFEDAKDASNSFDRHKLIIDAHQNLMTAQYDLKSAHVILQQILKLVKPSESSDDDNDSNQTCTANVPNLSQKNFGYIIYKNNCDNKTWNVVIKDTTNHGFTAISTIKSNVSAYIGKEVRVKGELKFIGVDINTDPRFVLESQGSQIRVNVFAPVSSNVSCSTCPVQNKTMIDMLNTQVSVLGNLSEINESNVTVPIITVTKLLTDLDLVSRANGTITTSGTFSDVKKTDFEVNDSLSNTNNTITFDVGMDALDRISFKTDGTVNYNLYIDGAHQKNFVYLGNLFSNPSDIPFSLTTI